VINRWNIYEPIWPAPLGLSGRLFVKEHSTSTSSGERNKAYQPPHHTAAMKCRRLYPLVSISPKTAPSLLRLAAIQYFERMKDSAGLAPKGRFIAAEPIKSEVGKVGEAQKATGELDSGSVGFHSRFGKRCHVAERTE
jgi:hypothetical protein